MRLIQMIAVAGLMVAPSAAYAQTAHGSHGQAGATARVAGIAPAPVIVNPGIAPGQFFTANLPVIVSPDGRVFANFGRGFEQIVTACGASQGIVVTNVQTTGVVQPTVVQPTVTQPGMVAGPLPYTPAVPNQQTASQQMIARSTVPVQQQQQQQVVVGNGMCWTSNGRGQVFIGRQ
jgi:hypothetical protein